MSISPDPNQLLNGLYVQVKHWKDKAESAERELAAARAEVERLKDTSAQLADNWTNTERLLRQEMDMHARAILEGKKLYTDEDGELATREPINAAIDAALASDSARQESHEDR